MLSQLMEMLIFSPVIFLSSGYVSVFVVLNSVFSDSIVLVVASILFLSF